MSPHYPNPQPNEAEVLRQNKAIMRRMLAAFETGQTRVVDEVISPDIVNHSTHPIMTASADRREGLKEEILLPREAFGDQYFKEEMIVAEGDMVFLGYEMTGIHQGSLYGRGGTGTAFALNGGDAIRIKDGLIVEHWDQYTKPRWESLIKFGMLDQELQEQLLIQGLL
jgi:ketosteroid isomerase-like protein